MPTSQPLAPGMRARPVSVAIGLTMASVIPNFLLGALAPDMRGELNFDSAALGALVMIANLVSGFTSVNAGRFVQKVGARHGGIAAMVMVAITLIGVAFAQAWWHLAVLLSLGGLAAALAQPAGNLILAREITPSRQGFAFGLKQAAVPAGSFIAGVAVPVASLWLGWRATWAVLGGIVLLFAFAGRKLLPVIIGEAGSPSGQLPPGRLPSLIALGVAGVFAGAAVVSMGTFLVETAVAKGFGLSAAGMLLSAASAAAIGTRVLQGWLADRRGKRHLITIARLMFIGAGGFVLVGTATSPVLITIGAIVGSAIGWGWNGILHFSVVHYHRSAPATASSFTQAGLFIGGAGGPFGFGLLVEHVSYEAAWLAAASSLVLGSVLVIIGRGVLGRAMRRDGSL